MTTGRQRLANRRGSVSFSFVANGLGYTATYSRFSDGRVAEVFLQNHRTNSGADVNARDSAIAASFALQHGGDLESLRKALSRQSRPPVRAARCRARHYRPRGLAMSVVRFPFRRIAAILVMRERDGGWLTLVGSNGWLFGSRAEALQEAAWLARNLDLPVRA
jgi:hypothetical protein